MSDQVQVLRPGAEYAAADAFAAQHRLRLVSSNPRTWAGRCKFCGNEMSMLQHRDGGVKFKCDAEQAGPRLMRRKYTAVTRSFQGGAGAVL